MKGVCEKCGRAPKVPGQGQRFCVDCKAAAEWAAARKRQTRVVRDRRPCVICGGVKDPGKGRDFCLKCKAARRKVRRCMRCPAEIPFPKKLCESCKAESVRKRREYDIARHRRYREKHGDPRVGKYKRKPDREGARMRHRLRAEREGRVIPPVPVLPHNSGRAVRYPLAPLLPFMRQYIAERDITELSETGHVRCQTLQQMLDGTLTELRDFQADRLCMAMGLQMSNVYLAQTG